MYHCYRASKTLNFFPYYTNIIIYTDTSKLCHFGNCFAFLFIFLNYLIFHKILKILGLPKINSYLVNEENLPNQAKKKFCHKQEDKKNILAVKFKMHGIIKLIRRLPHFHEIALGLKLLPATLLNIINCHLHFQQIPGTEKQTFC